MICLRQLLLFAFLFLLPHTAFAIDLTESLQLHGFVAQGYLKSSDNNFLAESRPGSYEFTDLGLNANWALFDGLRIGGQLFYRNLGDYAEDKITLDWALLDYQPHDWFGIRLGKVKMPLGLYNENRDNDFLLPLIFLPQSIYDESRRDTNLAYLGGGIYGNLSAGSWGDVDYHLFVGQTSYPKDSILTAGTENSLRSSISKNAAKPLAARNPLIPNSLQSHDRKSDGLYGGALIFNSAANLRLGLSLLHSENTVYLNGLPFSNNEVKCKFVVSLEYSWQDWMLVTEYGETDRQTVSAGVVTMDGPSQAWYGMLSYAPGQHWTFSVLYDEFYRLKHDKDGATRPQTEPYMGWRKDLGIAVRYDITDSLNFKAEYHNVDGGAMQLGVLNGSGVDRFWNYLAAKISYSF